jgi:hypothetical protein
VIKPNWALCVIEKTKIPLNHTEIVAAAKLLVEIRNELQDDLGAYAVAMRDQYGDEKLREFAHDIAHDALYTGSWLANYRLKVNAACRRGRRWPLPWEPAGPRKRTGEPLLFPALAGEQGAESHFVCHGGDAHSQDRLVRDPRSRSRGGKIACGRTHGGRFNQLLGLRGLGAAVTRQRLAISGGTPTDNKRKRRTPARARVQTLYQGGKKPGIANPSAQAQAPLSTRGGVPLLLATGLGSP